MSSPMCTRRKYCLYDEHLQIIGNSYPRPTYSIRLTALCRVHINAIHRGACLIADVTQLDREPGLFPGVHAMPTRDSIGGFAKSANVDHDTLSAFIADAQQLARRAYPQTAASRQILARATQI